MKSETHGILSTVLGGSGLIVAAAALIAEHDWLRGIGRLLLPAITCTFGETLMIKIKDENTRRQLLDAVNFNADGLVCSCSRPAIKSRS